MDRVKTFLYMNVLGDKMICSKHLSSIQEQFEHWDIGLYGIIETKEGYVLYEIDLRYNGEPFVYRKFMHYDSFKRFYPHRKMVFLDSQAEKFIKNI